MKKKQDPPLSFRVNEEDQAVLDYLCGRLGLKMPQVVKLAIRRLQEQEKRAEKK
jgi:phage-related holin